MISVGREEDTGQPILNRIQARIRQAIDAINDLYSRQPLSIALEKDFTTTSTTAALSALRFPCKKGALYVVEGAFRSGNSGSAGGLKFALIAPTGSTCSGHLDSTLANQDSSTVQNITAINTLTGAVHTVNGSTRADRMNVRVKAGADGIIGVAIATATGGDTATLAAESWLTVTTYERVRNV